MVRLSYSHSLITGKVTIKQHKDKEWLTKLLYTFNSNRILLLDPPLKIRQTSQDSHLREDQSSKQLIQHSHRNSYWYRSLIQDS